MTVVEVAGDTCDACPAVAQVHAYLYVELPSGRSLSLCAHHGTRHYDALILAGATIIDLRHLVQP